MEFLRSSQAAMRMLLKSFCYCKTRRFKKTIVCFVMFPLVILTCLTIHPISSDVKLRAYDHGDGTFT